MASVLLPHLSMGHCPPGAARRQLAVPGTPVATGGNSGGPHKAKMAKQGSFTCASSTSPTQPIPRLPRGNLDSPQGQNGQARIVHGARPNQTRMHDVHGNQAATTNACATHAMLMCELASASLYVARTLAYKPLRVGVCVCVCVLQLQLHFMR